MTKSDYDAVLIPKVKETRSRNKENCASVMRSASNAIYSLSLMAA
jgi:hypothetical protein